MFHLSDHHHQHSSSPPPLHSPLSLSLPCNLFWSIHRLLILTGDGAVLKGGWLTGCLASSGEGLLSGCGTRLEVTVQRARDRNQITTEGQLSCIVAGLLLGLRLHSHQQVTVKDLDLQHVNLVRCTINKTSLIALDIYWLSLFFIQVRKGGTKKRVERFTIRIYRLCYVNLL